MSCLILIVITSAQHCHKNGNSPDGGAIACRFIDIEDDMVLAYERRLGEQKLVVFCNMDGEQYSIKMADEWKNYKALLENYEWKKPALSGKIYSMEPYELLVLAKNPLHESLEIPDDGNFDYPELKAIVKEVNSTQVLPAERLSDEVYRYDSKDKVFEKVATFETRQKEKASVKPNKAEHDQPQKATKKHKSNDMLF